MSKYNRVCKGVTIDVYDVLTAFNVTNPALQHLVKKALCAGLRGHKDKAQDMAEILESAKRAVELEKEHCPQVTSLSDLLEGLKTEVEAYPFGKTNTKASYLMKWQVEK